MGTHRRRRDRVTDFAAFVHGGTASTSTTTGRCGAGRSTTPTAFWQACGTTSSLRSPPTGDRPGRRRRCRVPVVSGRDAQLRRPGLRNARRPARPAILYVGEDGTGRSRSGGRAAIARSRRSRARCASTESESATGWSATCRTFPRPSSRSSPRRSLGAVWARCGQDYSAPAALDRLGQLEPTALITADGYRFGGKEHDRPQAIGRAARRVCRTRRHGGRARTSIRTPPSTARVTWAEADRRAPANSSPWPSTSTTRCGWCSPRVPPGLPKGIVHGHGGVLLEHLKSLALHLDIGPDDTFFWYTSPELDDVELPGRGPAGRRDDRLLRRQPVVPDGPDRAVGLVARRRVTVLGTSPGYVLACVQGGRRPAVRSRPVARCARSASPARRCRRRRRCGCARTSATGFRSPRSAAGPTWCRRSSVASPTRAGVAG